MARMNWEKEKKRMVPEELEKVFATALIRTSGSKAYEVVWSLRAHFIKFGRLTEKQTQYLKDFSGDRCSTRSVFSL